MEPADQNQQDELASLESNATIVETTGVHAGDGIATPPSSMPGPPSPQHKPNRLLVWLRSRLNLYLMLFILLLIGAAATGTVLYIRTNTASQLLPQALSQNALNQLSTSDVTVGEPKHTLSVQSDTVFNGDVLVRDNLQIAGTLQVGSDLAIAGLRVTGNSTFDDIQITKSLALTGDGSIQGQLNVQKGLNVNGGGIFLGALSAPALTVSSLQLSGDLNLTHHVSAGGTTPSRSNGPAIGSGGTTSVSGSDTAGTVTINTGSGPSAGCFITVSFSATFNSTPHMSLTPVGSAAADLSYYLNRSTTSFSVCSTTAPPASSTITFDYIAFD